jgi:hypothetical protein
MDIFKTPRDAAVAAQRNPVLWPGTDERFTGYGVMGLPFRSGHYLAMRHIPASSIGPEYRTVWHYAPDGTWTFITDRRPEHTCARYFAPGDSALTLYADIASKWDGPHSLRVTVPDMLDWRIELGSTPATVMMTALSHRLPPIAWRSNAFQRGVNAVAPALLRAGRVGMSGTAPNGQRFARGTAANLDDCEQPRRSSRRGSRPATSATPTTTPRRFLATPTRPFRGR